MQLSPDSSIQNLKEKIHARFIILPEHQFLICNGKPLEASDTATIKQARIPNGSKILCSSRQREEAEEESSNNCDIADIVMVALEKIEADLDIIEAKLIGLLKQRRELMEANGEIKKIKSESKKVGEALMQLFESLDRLECGDQTQRTRRKHVATKINSVLDKNDNLSSKLSSIDS